jgi:hypothetical protein
MIDIGVLKSEHDQYTKDIREISSETDDLMFLRRKARTEGERLRYDAAILNNGLAINRACQERLKLTLQVIG